MARTCGKGENSQILTSHGQSAGIFTINMFLPAKRVHARTASPYRLPGYAALIVLLASSALAQESSSVTGSAQPHSRPEPTAVVAASAAPITFLEDTRISVMIVEAITSRHAEQGSPLLFTVSEM